jgi:plastocyanin
MRLGIALLAFGIVLTACSSSPSTTPTSMPGTSGGPASSGSTITIQNFSFSPATLRVAPGTHVSIVNKDNVAHTVTSTSGVFDTGDVQPGGSAHFTAPSKPGTYAYRCSIHQFMSGTLVVTSG